MKTSVNQDEGKMLRILPGQMKGEFVRILLKNGFTQDRAMKCAEIFTDNSVDGIYTHGVNRFSTFVRLSQKGFIDPNAELSLTHKFGAMEQWSGNLGPGPLNAMKATQIAMGLASEHGIGCVSLANTNHWMRGGAYGWQAARAGFVFIGWTNTIANMPAWGAVDRKLGNNPLVFALPFGEEAIVLDMAMSQFSYGSMELSAMKHETLSVYGGYDEHGQLTRDPAAIIRSKRPLPIGYWKGAGLSLLLDILATILSGGSSVQEISKREMESGLSQVFIVIDINKLRDHPGITLVIENIMKDYHSSIPENKNRKIVYPGERVLENRKNNISRGIPVLKEIWEEIEQL